MVTTGNSTSGNSSSCLEDRSTLYKSPQEQSDLINRIQDSLTKKFQVYSGKDTNGIHYESIQEMWQQEGFLSQDDDKVVKKVPQLSGMNENSLPQWYNKSHEYWHTESNVPATIDGMLGGFATLSSRDLEASRLFLKEIVEEQPLLKKIFHNREQVDEKDVCRSCECGAGIGRVTKGLFLPFGFQSCHLVETSSRLLEAAPSYIGEPDATEKCRYIHDGLQDFSPEPNTYDIIWVQWVIGYLTDWHAVEFFIRMGKALKPDGVIVLKDNTCTNEAFLADKGDSDVTRSYGYLMALVQESGLTVVKDGNGDDLIKWQDDFPDEIFPVPMIALEWRKGEER
jgi:protein N-terminal methyltransferase